MKKIHRVLALLLAALMALGLMTTAFDLPQQILRLPSTPARKHPFLSTSTTSPRPATTARGMLSPTFPPACMTTRLSTS